MTCLLIACAVASLIDVVTVGVIPVAVADDENNHYHHSGPSLLRASNSHHHQSQHHPQHGSPSTPSNRAGPSTVQQPQISQNVDFLDWSLQLLGITTTSLKIETFEYYDYMKALSERTDQFTEDDDDWIFYEETSDSNTMDASGQEQQLYTAGSTTTSVEDYPRIRVRGLAASEDIPIGQVVIRIPYQALLTVSNLVDRDPVLSRIIGKKARRQYGWSNNAVEKAEGEAVGEDRRDDDEEGDDGSVHYYYELPLLAVALLHHVKLGQHSSMAPYIQLLQTSPVDSMPHMWDNSRLRLDTSEAIRRIARGIQRDVREMYAQVVQVLIVDHPDLFGNPNQRTRRTPEDEDEVESDDEDDLDDDHSDENFEVEWYFSFEKFQWAFALVNSRHFHLPIPPSSNAAASASSGAPHNTRRIQANEERDLKSNDHEDNNAVAMDSPPAAMPTEDWIQHQKNDDDNKGSSSSSRTNHTADGIVKDAGEDGEAGVADDAENVNSYVVGSSFLAPVADLLNFGPPCTRGRYNAELQSFDIIATCNLTRGQEITFWYNSDACDDVILANYGFTHPMVPKCLSLKDWKKRAEIYQEQVHHLQWDLSHAYSDLDRIDNELDRVLQILHSCGDCCGDGIKEKLPDPTSSDSRRPDRSIQNPRAPQRYPPSPHLLRNDDTPNSATNVLQRGTKGPNRSKLPNRKSDRGL